MLLLTSTRASSIMEAGYVRSCFTNVVIFPYTVQNQRINNSTAYYDYLDFLRLCCMEISTHARDRMFESGIAGAYL